MCKLIDLIAEAKTRIEDRGLMEEYRDSTEFNFTFPEFVRFQELKSLAFACDRIPLDLAQTAYNFLGETPDHINKQPIEVKVVMTGFFAQLLAWTIKEQRKANR